LLGDADKALGLKEWIEGEGHELVTSTTVYGLVPAVVARTRLFGERLERIYADHVLFRHRFPPCGLKPRFSYPFVFPSLF
jgi:hypothetical protein